MGNIKTCPYGKGTGIEEDGSNCVFCHGTGKVHKYDLVTDPDYFKGSNYC
jgi:DnaJ-class molecular chaperone